MDASEATMIVSGASTPYYGEYKILCLGTWVLRIRDIDVILLGYGS